MKDKDKIYYLYNKTQYYTNLINIKNENKNKYELLIEQKSKEIKRLQELIHEKEMSHESSNAEKRVDIMSNLKYLKIQKKRKICRNLKRR